jgi:phosphatidylglycerophosphatase A
MLRDPGHCLALGLGSGLVRYAPGTWGSLAGVALYWPLQGLGPMVYFSITGLLFAIGIPLSARTAAALGSHDHGAIVIDEIVGMLLTVSFCSSGPIGVLVGFCAFRFFDIVKPWPIRVADRQVRGGLGIMLDDVLAAGYALLVVETFEYFSFGYRIFQ